MEPSPKNPIIAAFFRNIGYADQLGSGLRNLFKYSKFYSGGDPKFIEGDVFRIIVPLSHQYVEETAKSTTQTTQSTTQTTTLTENPFVQSVLKLIEQEPFLSQAKMAEKLGVNQNTLKYYMKKMKNNGIVERLGSSRKGKWVIK